MEAEFLFVEIEDPKVDRELEDWTGMMDESGSGTATSAAGWALSYETFSTVSALNIAAGQAMHQVWSAMAR